MSVEVPMRAYGWFIVGFVVMFFAAMSLSACAFDASGLGNAPSTDAGADPDPAENPTMTPSRITLDDPAFYHPAPKVTRGLTATIDPWVIAEKTVVAGSSVYVATLRLHNSDVHPHAVSQFALSVAEPAMFENLGYVINGAPIRSDVIVPTAEGDVAFRTTELVVAPGGDLAVSVLATLSPISTSDALPHSGDRSIVELRSLTDDASREIGVDGDRVLSALTLRKSMPTLSAEPLDDHLRLGWQDIYRVRITPDVAGDLAIKQFAFRVEIDASTLCRFRLRRGTKLVTSSYAITAFPGDGSAPVDAKASCLHTDALFVATFATEERVVVGSDLVYALRADVDAVDSFDRTRARLDLVQPLVSSALVGTSTPVVTLENDVLPGLIWSDLSAVSHRSRLPSSSDWIGGVSEINLLDWQEID